MYESFQDKPLTYEEIDVEPFESAEPALMDCGKWIYASSVFGRRSENQDRIWVDGKHFVVIDGMGGYIGGGEAADVVLDKSKQLLVPEADQGKVIRDIQDSLKEKEIDSGAAFIVGTIGHKSIELFYSGDCDCRVYDDKGNQVFSLDKKSLGDVTRRGNRGTIHKTTVSLRSRFRVVVASDGLWDNVEDVELPEVIKRGSIKDVFMGLAEMARSNMTGGQGNRDNLTILVCEIIPQDLLKNLKNQK